MKNKLTGGYRKRLSGSRAINENVKFFPDFLFVTGSASRPRLKNSIALTVKQNRLYKPHTCHKGAASAQRAAPGRAAKIGVALRKRQVRPKFRHFMISPPCEFCAQQPTLPSQNLTSNKFSWTKRAICHHKHIMKNKLTGGYRKRLSGSRAINENVKIFPDFLFVTGSASRPRA